MGLARVWLVMGCAGLLVSIWEAWLNIEAFIRHMDTGDQAGFGLGMLFLFVLFMPATAAALLLGAVPGPAVSVAPAIPETAPPSPARDDPMRSGIVFLLRAGAIAMILFVIAWSVCEGIVGQRGGPSGRHALLLPGLLVRIPVLAFAGVVWGCGAAVMRPDAARSPWFIAALGVSSLAQGIMLAAIVWNTTPVALLQVLVTFGGPVLIYVLVALRTFWVLRRPWGEPPAPAA